MHHRISRKMVSILPFYSEENHLEEPQYASLRIRAAGGVLEFIHLLTPTSVSNYENLEIASKMMFERETNKMNEKFAPEFHSNSI